MSLRHILFTYINHLNDEGLGILRQAGNDGARFGTMDESRRLNNGRWGIPIFNLNRISTLEEKQLIDLFPRNVEPNIVKFMTGDELKLEIQVNLYDPEQENQTRARTFSQPLPVKKPISCGAFLMLIILLIIVCCGLYYIVISGSEQFEQFQTLWTASFSDQYTAPPVKNPIVQDTVWPTYIAEIIEEDPFRASSPLPSSAPPAPPPTKKKNSNESPTEKETL